MKKVMEEKRQEVAKQMEMQAVNNHETSYYTGRPGQPVRGPGQTPQSRQQYKQVCHANLELGTKLYREQAFFIPKYDSTQCFKGVITQ